MTTRHPELDAPEHFIVEHDVERAFPGTTSQIASNESRIAGIEPVPYDLRRARSLERIRSCVVRAEDVERAVNAVHERFRLFAEDRVDA